MNTSKYIALAFSSPKGCEFRDKIEEAWPQWLRHVEISPWLRNFSASPLFKSRTRARTPSGVMVAGWPRYPHHAVADAIFSTAVWGFGVEQRDEHSMYWDTVTRDLQAHRRSSICIYGMNVSRSQAESALPLMFKELDEWLDTLWV